MARPPSGNPRNVVVTVRLTRGEEEALRASFGTPGRGVRALLDKALKSDASRTAGAVEGAPQEVEVGEVAEVQKKAAAHRHKRGEIIRTEHVAGQAVKIYQCAVDDCMKELR